MTASVQGHCPECGHEDLWLGAGGLVVCNNPRCPNPAAVSHLLEDSETEHVVDLNPLTFTVRHPLRERIGDALMTCPLHDAIARLDAQPYPPGRYRVSAAPISAGWPGPSATPGWLWTVLDE